ncbi:hypothetical protein WJX74_002142 [Apatococcus lobatus]|uniref:Uncharacterized protein n=1 Tax=Apatococcus lobatus TaxID=904363 RepID=A0AAW1QDE8_9CHLO
MQSKAAACTCWQPSQQAQVTTVVRQDRKARRRSPTLPTDRNVKHYAREATETVQQEAQWHVALCSVLSSLMLLQAAPGYAAGPKDLSSSLQSSQNALSNLLGSSSMDDDADPWTLYGTSRKKYAIEKRDGEKILSRRKGFTVDTCTSGIAANQESPSFQGASTSEKLSMLDWQSCSRAEAPDLKQACVQTCGEACASGIKQYEERSLKASGLRMSTEDRSRLERSCNRQCPYQCNKPGQQYGFVVPFRR